MQSYKEQKEYISYSDVIKQINTLPILKEIVYQIDKKFSNESIDSIIKRLPQLPEANINVSPSFEVLKERYQTLIDSALKKTCSLSQLYGELFIILWNDRNIMQFKKAMDIAVNNAKITVTTHYRLNKFFSALCCSKNEIASTLENIKNNTFLLQKASLDQEILYERSLQEFIKISGISKALNGLIEQALIEEVSGWKQFNAINAIHIAEKIDLNSLGSAEEKADYEEKMIAVKKVWLNKKSNLPIKHILYEASIQYIDIDKDDLESIIKFINRYINQFSNSFKLKINPVQMRMYINDYREKISKKNISIACLLEENEEIDFDYKMIQHDFLQLNCNWRYALAVLKRNIFLKKFYCLAALRRQIEQHDTLLFRHDFFEMLDSEINHLLCKKKLSHEAQVAIVQAALDCFAHRTERHVQLVLKDYIAVTENKSEDKPYEKKISNILADLDRKEKQYHQEMPSDSDDHYQRVQARIIFLRLIAVHYIRNKILANKTCSPSELHHELIEIDEGILERRGFGCGRSHIVKVLEKLDSLDFSKETTPVHLLAQNYKRWSY